MVSIPRHSVYRWEDVGHLKFLFSWLFYLASRKTVVFPMILSVDT